MAADDPQILMHEGRRKIKLYTNVTRHSASCIKAQLFVFGFGGFQIS